jgi:hypothetical protein
MKKYMKINKIIMIIFNKIFKMEITKMVRFKTNKIKK